MESYYRITTIQSKDPDTYNLCHDAMFAKRCERPAPIQGERCFIRYELYKDIWDCLYTSIVQSFQIMENGDIELETANTFYHLKKLEAEP